MSYSGLSDKFEYLWYESTAIIIIYRRQIMTSKIDPHAAKAELANLLKWQTTVDPT